MLPSEDDLPTRLANWLESQGYPLEIEVARAFREAGFKAIQADYYIDPVSKANREIDLVAHADKYVLGLLARISFIVECKTARDKPWVLFTAPQGQLADKARVVQRAASKLGADWLHAIAAKEEI